MKQPVRTRNRRGDGARLRDDILAGATAILDETGDEQAVTLRAVARRVGISAPSIYSHFRDRDAVLLAVVQDAFAELDAVLRAVNDVKGRPRDPATHLRAVSNAYLDYAAKRSERYRVMFGGLWNGTHAIAEATVTVAEVEALGREALSVFVDALDRCVRSGVSASSDTRADAIALWIGLHGLAHQRAVTAAFPWPPDIADRLTTSLGRLVEGT